MSTRTQPFEVMVIATDENGKRKCLKSKDENLDVSRVFATDAEDAKTTVTAKLGHDITAAKDSGSEVEILVRPFCMG